MKLIILDRYIARTLIATILVVSLALLGLDIFFSVVNELRMIGRGNYSLSSALTFIGLTSLNRLYLMFPWSALIGTLISLGMMATQRELVVMRTSSISVNRICYAVVKAAVILTIGMVIIGEGIAPYADRYAQNKKTFEVSGGQSIETPYGLWIRQGQEFIHVQTLVNSKELLGVTRYQFDHNRRLQQVSFSEKAIKEGKVWRLQNTTGTQFLKDRTETIQRKEETVPTLLETEVLETAGIKHPERLPILSLWRVIQNRYENDLSATSYELAFWNKVFQPLLIIIMVVLAVPFVFGPLRSVSMGFRIVAGIFVAYLFHTFSALFAPLALVYQVPPLFAVLIPFVVFAGIGLFLLRRVK